MANWQNFGGWHKYKGAYDGAGLKVILQYDYDSITLTSVKLRFYAYLDNWTESDDNYTAYFYNGSLNGTAVTVYPGKSGRDEYSGEFYCVKESTVSTFTPGDFWLCNNGSNTFNGRGGYTGYATGARKNFKSSATGRQTSSGFIDFGNQNEGHGYTGSINGPLQLSGSFTGPQDLGNNTFRMNYTIPQDSNGAFSNKVTEAHLYWKIGEGAIIVSPSSYTGSQKYLSLSNRTGYVDVPFSADTNACTYLEVKCNYGNADADNSQWRQSGTYHENPIFNDTLEIRSSKSKNSKNAIYTAHWSSANRNGCCGSLFYRYQIFLNNTNIMGQDASKDLSGNATSASITDELNRYNIKLTKGNKLKFCIIAINKHDSGYETYSPWLIKEIEIESSGVLNVKIDNSTFKESSNVYVKVNNEWKEASDIYVRVGNDWKEST